MKPHVANLLNALVLIVMGCWGYFGSENPSFTALIPVGFGVVLMLMHTWLKKENKVVAHIVVVLTLLILVALVKPLLGQIEKENTMGIVRVGAMILTSILAMITFVQSFIAARKSKA